MKRLYAIVVVICENIISFCSVILFSSFKVNSSFKKLRDKVSLYDDAFILANGSTAADAAVTSRPCGPSGSAKATPRQAMKTRKA